MTANPLPEPEVITSHDPTVLDGVWILRVKGGRFDGIEWLSPTASVAIERHSFVVALVLHFHHEGGSV